MNDIVLSILIPVYNGEKFIDECIKSVRSNSLSDKIEIVIINDGSTDNTESILSEISNDRIHIYNQPNFGIGETRNALLDKSKGEFFWFVDSDDYIEPDSVNLILNCIDDTVDIIELSYGITDSNNRKLTEKHFDGFYNSGKDFVRKGNFENTVWNKVIRRNIVEQYNVRFDKLVTGEDFLFSYKVLSVCGAVRTINSICYWYRLNENSICSKRDDDHMMSLSESTIDSLCSLADFNKKMNIDEDSPMYNWINHYIIGYFFSLVRFSQYKLIYIDSVINKLKQMGFFPLNCASLSFRERIFYCLFCFEISRKLLKTYFKVGC